MASEKTPVKAEVLLVMELYEDDAFHMLRETGREIEIDITMDRTYFGGVKALIRQVDLPRAGD